MAADPGRGRDVDRHRQRLWHDDQGLSSVVAPRSGLRGPRRARVAYRARHLGGRGGRGPTGAGGRGSAPQCLSFAVQLDARPGSRGRDRIPAIAPGFRADPRGRSRAVLRLRRYLLDPATGAVNPCSAPRWTPWRPGIPTSSPGTAAVLSLAYSNVLHNGVVHGWPFNQCTRSEMLDECLVQLGLTGHADAIADAVVDPDLRYMDEAVFAGAPDEYAGYVASRIPGSSLLIATQSTLYIRDLGNLTTEPKNETETENLFLAGEFTSTRFGLPTIEKANESGIAPIASTSALEYPTILRAFSRFRPAAEGAARLRWAAL